MELHWEKATSKELLHSDGLQPPMSLTVAQTA
jgi:hypothetical protein